MITLTHQEARLYEIMEMGTTVEEVLDVERELERVRGRIESIQGRIQFLTNRVSLSTITVNLFVEEEEVEIEVKLAWFPEVDWSEPVRTGLAVVTTVAQGMITMSIVIVPFIAIAYGALRTVQWYRSGKLPHNIDDEESPELI